MKGSVKGSMKGSVKKSAGNSANRKETAMHLLRAMSDAEDEYIEEAVRFRAEREPVKREKSRMRSLRTFAGWFAAAACVILAFTGYYAVRRQTIPEDETVAVGVPYQEMGSLEEAEAAAGFDLSVPETVLSGEKVSIAVYDGGMIQVTYGRADGKETVCYIRKAEGTEDISGDYNEYAEVTVQTIHGKEVTLKGNDGTISAAVWTSDGYSYAVGTVDRPMTPGEMTDVIEKVE